MFLLPKGELCHPSRPSKLSSNSTQLNSNSLFVLYLSSLSNRTVQRAGSFLHFRQTINNSPFINGSSHHFLLLVWTTFHFKYSSVLIFSAYSQGKHYSEIFISLQLTPPPPPPPSTEPYRSKFSCPCYLAF